MLLPSPAIFHGEIEVFKYISTANTWPATDIELHLASVTQGTEAVKPTGSVPTVFVMVEMKL